jgi:hypothetical protein
VICHCVSCRATSGALTVAWVSFPYRSFSFIEGEPADYRSSDDVSRTFCQSCGTSLTYRDDEDADSIDVTTASLDRPGEFPPTRHIWLEDKLAWEVVDDGLTRFERGG